LNQHSRTTVKGVCSTISLWNLFDALLEISALRIAAAAVSGQSPRPAKTLREVGEACLLHRLSSSNSALELSNPTLLTGQA